VQQNLTIAGPNVPVAASAQAGNGPTGWFSVAPSSANIVNGALVLTVTVNTGFLTAGVQYQGAL